MEIEKDTTHEVTLTVNGEVVSREIPARRLLIHFLREDLRLRGPKVGCDTGHCGACTVSRNGETVKSCMVLAVQTRGDEIETVESLTEDGELNTLQQAFREHHALQCGYCTPGMLMSSRNLLQHNPQPTAEEVRAGLHGNVCRCTGYVNIVEAVQAAAQEGGSR
ncbi:(2Fe-2S)-binding protein [Egibacter rhizosphaerae]|uniref:(2Fe-2S)-binding protein n=1 Tax=Egibacter rhizosphaerae TaxID=1670831 RepID=UPI001F0F9A04|nr:(2Fe-2S)-binding protein [Egibacter rhizosphaerae]